MACIQVGCPGAGRDDVQLSVCCCHCPLCTSIASATIGVVAGKGVWRVSQLSNAYQL